MSDSYLSPKFAQAPTGPFLLFSAVCVGASVATRSVVRRTPVSPSEESRARTELAIWDKASEGGGLEQVRLQGLRQRFRLSHAAAIKDENWIDIPKRRESASDPKELCVLLLHDHKTWITWLS